MSNQKSSIVFTIIVLTLIFAGNVYAVCKNTLLNPISDINWNAIFPIKIGGVTLRGSDIDTSPDRIKSPICLCGTRLGLTVSFWEPARMIETVKDPYCFPSIGVKLTNPKPGFLGGTYMEQNPMSVDTSTFAQSHWYIFPVWGMLDLFLDLPCLEGQPFDIAYITEIDPTWNSSLLSFILNPEALLFANPIAQVSCIADSVASNAGVPLSPLFWCMGSWGSAYPLSGHTGSDNYVQANAALAARMIYKQGRQMALWDTGIDKCGPVPTPIWVKENYRMHIVKPVKDKTAHPIGRSSLIWGQLKNPPYGSGGNSGDNFLWMLFRKRLCCVGYTF